MNVQKLDETSKNVSDILIKFMEKLTFAIDKLLFMVQIKFNYF